MAAEALDLLLQTLLHIRERDDDLTTRRVKHGIICIHDKAVILLHFLQHFPEKEVIREVANTAKEIIEYLFSPLNLSADRLPDQLRELGEELDSTVGDVVDYCKIISNDVSDSPSIYSSSRSAPVELIVINTNGLRRLAEKFKSCGRELADEDASDSTAATTKYFAKDPSDSPSISPPMTNHDVVVVGFDEDIQKLMNRLTDDSSYLQILPIVGMGGIGKSTLAKSIYDHPFIIEHFDIRAWVTVSQDYSLPSILSQLLASLKGKVDRLGRDSLKVIEAEELEQDNTIARIHSKLLASLKTKEYGDGRDFLNEIEAEKHEIDKLFCRRKYLIVMDDVWSAEAFFHIRMLFPNNHNGTGSY